MLKRIFKIVTPIILIFIILLIGYNTYKETLDHTENPLTIMPSNTAVILQFNDVKNISTVLENTNIWKRLLTVNTLQTSNTKLKNVSEFFTRNQTIFNSNAFFVSFHKVGANTSSILYSANFSLDNINSNKEVTSLFGT